MKSNPAFSFRNGVEESVLTRFSSIENSTFNETQKIADQAVSGFLEGAVDPKTLAAMTAGGLAYRFGKIGTLLAGSHLGQGSILPFLVRGSSYLIGFGAESFIFAGVNRGFKILDGQAPHQSFAKDWAHSALTLAPLKVFPALFREQNLPLQHLLTDAGMVTGNHLAYKFHVGEKPEGNLAIQFFHAEAMNWQMKAGMGLLHNLAPGLTAFEKGLDLSIQAKEQGHLLKMQSFFTPQLAIEGIPLEIQGSEKRDPLKETFGFQMSSQKDKPGGLDNKDEAQVTFKSGDIIKGKYRILFRLEEGHFSEAWKAEDIEGGGEVILKIVKRSLEVKEHESALNEDLRRFEREIEIITNLEPQNKTGVEAVLPLKLDLEDAKSFIGASIKNLPSEEEIDEVCDNFTEALREKYGQKYLDELFRRFPLVKETLSTMSSSKGGEGSGSGKGNDARQSGIPLPRPEIEAKASDTGASQEAGGEAKPKTSQAELPEGIVALPPLAKEAAPAPYQPTSEDAEALEQLRNYFFSIAKPRDREAWLRHIAFLKNSLLEGIAEQALRTDAEVSVKIEAARALGAIGTVKTHEALEATLLGDNGGSENPLLRAECAASLAKIPFQDPPTEARLIEALERAADQDADLTVREAAAESLKRLSGETAEAKDENGLRYLLRAHRDEDAPTFSNIAGVWSIEKVEGDKYTLRSEENYYSVRILRVKGTRFKAGDRMILIPPVGGGSDGDCKATAPKLEVLPKDEFEKRYEELRNYRGKPVSIAKSSGDSGDIVELFSYGETQSGGVAKKIYVMTSIRRFPDGKLRFLLFINEGHAPFNSNAYSFGKMLALNSADGKLAGDIHQAFVEQYRKTGSADAAIQWLKQESPWAGTEVLQVLPLDFLGKGKGPKAFGAKALSRVYKIFANLLVSDNAEKAQAELARFTDLFPRMGAPEKRSIAGEMIDLLKHPKAEVRDALEKLLPLVYQELDEQDRLVCAQKMAAHLDDSDEQVRTGAIRHLAFLLPLLESKDRLAPLLRILATHDDESAAVQTEASSAVSQLTDLLIPRDRARFLLAMMEAGARAQGYKNGQDRVFALKLLGKLFFFLKPEERRELALVLEARLEDPEEEVRLTALRFLQKIGHYQDPSGGVLHSVGLGALLGISGIDGPLEALKNTWQGFNEFPTSMKAALIGSIVVAVGLNLHFHFFHKPKRS